MYPTISYLIKDLTGYWIPLPFATFGCFVALSFLVSSLIFKRELKRKERENLIRAFRNKEGELVYPHQVVANMILLAALWGLIGARLFSILEYPDDFFLDPYGVLFAFSGLTFYGGLIFGTIAVLFFARKRKIRIVPLLDTSAPALMLAYAIGRIGCQLAGDGDWGIDNLALKPSWLNFIPDWCWAYRYPHNVNDIGIPIENCVGKYCHVLENPVFPTPLYEILICTTLFLILWSIRKKISTPGILFSIYLILNGIERFFIEKIRIDIDYQIGGVSIKQAEIISGILVLSGIFGLLYLLRNSQHNGNILYK